MSRIFFTSDLHLGHANILQFEPGRITELHLSPIRVDDSCVEHDEALIARINSRVKPEDKLFILGDVGLASSGYLRNCVQRINGHKHLVRGNHDKHTDSHFYKMGFEVVCYEMTLKISNHFVRLSHYPYRKPWYKAYFPWQWKEKDRHKRPVNYGNILLHGHIHSGGQGVGDGSHLVRDKMINVGVDVHNYYPVGLDKIEQLIQKMVC